MARNRKKNGGIINRLIVGKEKSEGYARASLPSNRWELFWDIFKGRFSKIFILNILMLLFFIPLFALLFFRYVALVNFGASYPFNQPFGVGYQALTSMIGYAENIVYTVDTMIYLFLPLVAMIGAIGVSGGAYVIRNIVWTEGVFVSNDFWRGIKQNIKPMLFIALLYSVVFYVIVMVVGLLSYMSAFNLGIKWLLTVLQIFSYLILAFISIMTMHMITMCVTYELKFTQLLRNSFLFTVGLMPQNIFFLALGAIPFILLMLGSFFMGLGILAVLIFGLSLPLLIWTDFCQWGYDKFINDKIPGVQKNRGIYEKVKENDSGALKQYREQLALTGRSSLASKPIKPITDDELTLAELPASFNRSDIEKLNASKKAIYEDHERYVEEHKNDAQFQPTEAEIQLEKEQEAKRKRIEKAKKELSKRNEE